MKAFRGILPLLEGCPLFWKGVSLQKQTPVTLPALLPIKIYWKHPGNTVRLISSQLACQKQINTAIMETKKKKKKGILPWLFWVHNRHLICCNDLQYDNSGKIYCDRLNGTQHKYNYSSHDLLHLPPPKEVAVDATQRGCRIRCLQHNLLFQFAPQDRLMPKNKNKDNHNKATWIYQRLKQQGLCSRYCVFLG